MIWSEIESLATAASAIVTAAMAWMTFRIIVQARKHHQDEYRPILSLTPIGVADPVRRECLLEAEPVTQQSTDCHYLLHGVLQNIGRGPALNVKLTVRFLSIEDFGTRTELAPLGAGERLDFTEHPLRLAARFHDGFKDTDFEIGPRSSWEILAISGIPKG